jgi:HD-like signal output (HDOD) protein/CheY-like chemotaxis protein
MPTIMVVDDQAIIREPIAAALRRAGYETVTANDGAEALQSIRAAPPALVVLDIAMPVLDGMSVLRALRASPRTSGIPVIMLTAAAERAKVVEAARLGISGYMLKSRFSLREMLAQVKNAIDSAASSASPASAPSAQMSSAPAAAAIAQPPATAVPVAAPQHPSATATLTLHSGPPADAADGQAEVLRSLRPIISRSELNERLEGFGELQGFSPVVSEVLRLTGNARCSIEHVAKAISHDHAIALKILKLANSVVYTRGEPVESVLKAVLRIGLGQIRQAVLNIAVVERFAGGGLDDFIDSSQFWEHAIATGIIAAELAHARDEKAADEAFTVGLLHDVGRMLFVGQLGDIYRQVLQTARDTQLPLEQVETRMLCHNHADIMDRVFRTWKFPREFINPIVFHHLSAGNIRSTVTQQRAEVATLALANRLAHAFMLGSSGNQTLYPTEELCELLGLDAQVIQRVEQIARPETDNVKFALLARSNQPNWPQLREVHRRELRVPLHPLYVSGAPQFDALRIFVGELAEPPGEPAARPNIAVISFRHVREQVPLSQKLAGMEASAGVGPLPLIVISPGGKILPERSLLNGRRLVVLSTPIPIRRFVEAANSLLATAAISQAA